MDSSFSLVESDYMYKSYTDKDVPGWGDCYYSLRAKGLVSGHLSDFSDTAHVLVTGVDENSLISGNLEIMHNPWFRVFFLRLEEPENASIGRLIVKWHCCAAKN